MKLLLILTITAGLLANIASQKRAERYRIKPGDNRRNDYQDDYHRPGYGQDSGNSVISLRSYPYAESIVPPLQNPPVMDAMDILRGRPPLTSKEAYDVLSYAQGGKDYPAQLEPPKTYFTCGNAKPGFYADLDSYCQAFHRCDLGGKQSTFYCPAKTLFNQITLVCDWFYNVNCQNSRQFSEYSNSRLYHPQLPVLDTQEQYDLPYTSVQFAPVQPIPVQYQQQPPNVLYPGRRQLSDQPYGSHGFNGHESPEYQMSVVIRKPQLIPDYSAGESSLVHKELQLDQGNIAPVTPASFIPSESQDNAGLTLSEQAKVSLAAREHAWRQQFRKEYDGQNRAVKTFPVATNMTSSGTVDSPVTVNRTAAATSEVTS